MMMAWHGMEWHGMRWLCPDRIDFFIRRGVGKHRNKMANTTGMYSTALIKEGISCNAILKVMCVCVCGCVRACVLVLASFFCWIGSLLIVFSFGVCYFPPYRFVLLL